MKKIIVLLGIIAILFLWIGFSVNAQQILLDQPTSAGTLTLFPDISDQNKYYYLSDKPKIALQPDGTPKFSFLNYVKNGDNGALGGGIVHAVIALDVTEEELQKARQALRSLNGNGEIVGPVMWKGGTIALISSFAGKDGDLAKEVLGIGRAPVLDNQMASVSIQLTQKGAEILWESFKTPTPDMSISFEMELQGFRAPRNAVIEADFDQIFEHKSFKTGVATPFLSADINAAFDELTRSGAIKITNNGADQQMEALITTAYNKLTQIMFDPIGGTGTPNLQQLTTVGNQGGSMLDRASKMLAAARKEAKDENQRIRAENRAELERARAAQLQLQQNNNAGGKKEGEPTEEKEDSKGGRPKPRNEQDKVQPGKAVKHIKPDVKPGLIELPEIFAPRLQEEASMPKLAIAASFQMKKTRNRGKFRIDLNKSVTDQIVMRFDENFGEYTKNCKTCFSQVNLDDPLYKQREILASVDGMNSADFGEFINYVTVYMTKQHEGGEISTDEMIINRSNFNKEGNNFKLIYGWKDDNSRNKWLDYQFKTSWSFFGGHKMETPLQKATTGAINLMPPFQRKLVTVEADPLDLETSGVRLINIKVFYKLDGKEFAKELTLNATKDPVAGTIEFLLPKGETDYEYEVTWQMRGNQMISSGRQKTSFNQILVDEIPFN
ncbi:hypothetical protein QQ020_33245 [Fulvivirgaceae bacterium BMA12]|uniref:Uncharacterized protein n=1 Tax=Agaribacillus aureus TaxID=3051825 RepID=A0ABT8LGQ7_9BACT|nr:hypothetical protein [Fulvivirgaceae bacterium BMA12]